MIKNIFKFIFTIITIGIVLYFLWIYVKPKLVERNNNKVNNESVREYVLVKKVIDGDTFIINDGNDSKVSILGADSPEKYQSEKLDKDAERTQTDKETLNKLGRLASDYTKKLLEKKKVRLVKEPNYEEKDQYGRLLRYVYLEDGTLFNKKIIEDGYAYAFRKYKISKLNDFIDAERDARSNKRGLWGETNGLKQFE